MSRPFAARYDRDGVLDRRHGYAYENFVDERPTGARTPRFRNVTIMIHDPPVRFATTRDISALDALINGAYRGERAKRGWTHEADLLAGYGNRIDETELAETLADPTARILVAYEGSELVGCILIRDLGTRLAYFGLLAIAPERQASGLAKQLLSAAEACARDLFNADRVEGTVVHTRSELIAYYERRGFARTGERRPFPIDINPPLELVVITKSLGVART